MPTKPIMKLVPLMFLAACATPDKAPSSTDKQTKSGHVSPNGDVPSTASSIAVITWKEGQSCTFEYNHNGRKAVRTETATRVDGDRVVLKLAGDGVSTDMVVEGDRVANGISIVDGQSLRFEPASKWVDYPMQPGTTWQDNKKVLGETFTAQSNGTWKAAGRERVKVPAGEYLALKVVMKESFRGRTKSGEGFSGSGTLSYWLASDLGCPVKMQYRNSFGEKGVRVLTALERSSETTSGE